MKDQKDCGFCYSSGCVLYLCEKCQEKYFPKEKTMSELIEKIEALFWENGTHGTPGHFSNEAIRRAIDIILQHEAEQQEMLKEVRRTLSYLIDDCISLGVFSGDGFAKEKKALATLDKLITQDEGEG